MGGHTATAAAPWPHSTLASAVLTAPWSSLRLLQTLRDERCGEIYEEYWGDEEEGGGGLSARLDVALGTLCQLRRLDLRFAEMRGLWDGERGAGEDGGASVLWAGAATSPTAAARVTLPLALTRRNGRNAGGNGPGAAQLPALQRLRGFTFVSLHERSTTAGQQPLPGGAWLRRLRTIWTHWHILAASAEVLSADAASLEECRALGAADYRVVSSWAWDSFWAFAAEHPPLRRLSLDGQVCSEALLGYSDELWQG